MTMIASQIQSIKETLEQKNIEYNVSLGELKSAKKELLELPEVQDKLNEDGSNVVEVVNTLLSELKAEITVEEQELNNRFAEFEKNYAELL